MDADKNKFIIKAQIVLATALSATSTKYRVSQIEPADFNVPEKLNDDTSCEAA